MVSSNSKAEVVWNFGTERPLKDRMLRIGASGSDFGEDRLRRTGQLCVAPCRTDPRETTPKESSSGFTTSLAGQAEELSDVKMELSKVSIRLGELIKTTKKQQEEACSESVVKKLREDFEAMQEQHHLLAERFEVTERAQQEDSDKFDRQIKDCNQHLERHSTTIEQDINAHLHELDDTLLSLKLDVESVQGSLTEANKSKASRAELAEMQKTLKAVLEEVEADHSTLEEAAANLGKLEMCISMAAENKSRTEELWRIFRGETQVGYI